MSYNRVSWIDNVLGGARNKMEKDEKNERKTFSFLKRGRQMGGKVGR